MIAALSLFLLSAAGLPYAQAQCPEPLTRRVYPIPDLAIPVPNCDVTIRKDGASWCADAPQADAPRTDETRLMQLIADTVAPESWVERGGQATMDYFPLGMCLVVKQTAKNHERIADLLQSLRRKQVEVALEVRFVTMAESFYKGLSHCAGVDIKKALGDKQTHKLLETVQADTRSNVLQAPRMTLSNGQNSTLDLTDRQFFVTGVSFGKVDGQTMCVPRNEPVQTGWQVSVQPVVSADRRYVRLHAKVHHDELAATPVQMVPVTSFVRPVFVGGAVGQPVPFTQYVQQPNMNRQCVEKTVTVPDGQTVVLNLGKALQQQRTETCPPVFGAIPYMNRLFKTVAYCQTAQHTLALVTPRIVIAEEEEEVRPPTACAPARQPQPVAQTSPAPCSDVIQATHLELVPPQRTEQTKDGPCVKNEHATKVLPRLRAGAAAADCNEAPDEAEVLRALPALARGVPHVYEVSRDDVQITTERLVDKVDPARFFPLIGPAQLHHCHWKCTAYYKETVRGSYPLPFQYTRPRVEVVYIDKDHLHLCTAKAAAGTAARQAPCCAAGTCHAAGKACGACQQARVAELLKEYEHACAAGELDSAARWAVQALAIDPACFSKDHRAGTASVHARQSIP
jgi:hypothetical protein